MYDPRRHKCSAIIELGCWRFRGSITACHLAANFQRYTVSFGDPAGELIDFCRETDLQSKGTD